MNPFSKQEKEKKKKAEAEVGAIRASAQ